MNIELREGQSDEIVIAEMLSLYNDLSEMGHDPETVDACVSILEYYLTPSDFRTFKEVCGIK